MFINKCNLFFNVLRNLLGEFKFIFYDSINTNNESKFVTIVTSSVYEIFGYSS